MSQASQSTFWAQKSASDNVTSTQESAEAQLFAIHVPTGSPVLELGFGHGHDARYFARNGYHVVGADVSVRAVELLGEKRPPNLHVVRLDLAQPLPFGTGAFAGVYARLSLHYFTDATTRSIFAEIARVLRPQGTLYAMCKSTRDRLYGLGVNVENDMYELEGHTRHFFSLPYMERTVRHTDRLRIDRISEDSIQLNGKTSCVIQALATRSP